MRTNVIAKQSSNSWMVGFIKDLTQVALLWFIVILISINLF